MRKKNLNYLIEIFFGSSFDSTFFGRFNVKTPFSYFASISASLISLAIVKDLLND